MVRALSEKLVSFLETGTVPEGLFRPDVFVDLTMPTWRVQAAGAEELIAESKQGHPGPGMVTRESATLAEPRYEACPRPDRSLKVWHTAEARGHQSSS